MLDGDTVRNTGGLSNSRMETTPGSFVQIAIFCPQPLIARDGSGTSAVWLATQDLRMERPGFDPFPQRELGLSWLSVSRPLVAAGWHLPYSNAWAFRNPRRPKSASTWLIPRPFSNSLRTHPQPGKV